MGTPSTRIWRTVVFAGAMLATPLAGCGGAAQKGTQPAEPAAAPAAKAGPDEAALDAERQNVREQELLAQKQAEADAARKAEEEAAAKAEADCVAEEERKAAEDRERMERLQRVRGSGGGPKGRGFVLA
jgi:hypothetical protein